MSRQDILPSSATDLERAYELTTAEAIAAIPVENIWTQWDPNDCQAHLLPWLAWAMSVDEWDSSWPESTKRAVIAASADIHRKRGTPRSIQEDLAAFAFDTTYREWRDDPLGVPHTITISAQATTAAPITPDDFAIIREKSLRDRAARDSISVEVESNASTGAVCANVLRGSLTGNLHCEVEPDTLQTRTITAHILGGELYPAYTATIQ